MFYRKRKSQSQPVESKRTTLTGISVLNLHIFSFLSAKDAKRSSVVSKEFKANCDYHADRASTHYVVGLGIHIATLAFTSVIYKKLPSVSKTQIQNSFLLRGMVRIFASKYDASTYARSLRTWHRPSPISSIGEKIKVTQPAVFKVKYFPKNEIKQVEENVLTTSAFLTSFLTGTPCFWAPIRYFNSDVDNLIPLQAELKIDLSDYGRVAEFPVFDWQEPAPQRCIIM